ncbi:hypothetical protein ACI3KS_08865 [Microbacterium sp. ZW T5_45]|uniref:hypothetical protein n=1 Tax=Microbacterium sp. ZW T5_45 TaxID=3378080 RepID=UPI0038555D1A
MLVYADHDCSAAEAAGLPKTDQGVYEVVAPWSELEKLEGVEISGAGSRER